MFILFYNLQLLHTNSKYNFFMLSNSKHKMDGSFLMNDIKLQEVFKKLFKGVEFWTYTLQRHPPELFQEKRCS